MESTLVIKRVPIDELHLDPANARQHGPENLEAITASLKRFGQAEPLVVQKSSGRVVGGNGRLVAMKKIGWTDADVVEVDIDDLDATALGIALNRTGELAEWDEETLAKLLSNLKEADALDGVGYDDTEIDALLDEVNDNSVVVIEDVAPEEPPEKPVSRTGDLWILGDHRLLCGDSTKPEDVERVLDGEKAALLATDPPYCVDYTGDNRPGDSGKDWSDTYRDTKKLVVNKKEARLVRRIFRRFCEIGSTTQLARELNDAGHTTKAWITEKEKTTGGRRWNKSHIYRLLNNQKYIGKVDHRGTTYEGEHDAIVPQSLWDEAHAILATNNRNRGNRTRSETPALLKGILMCGHCDCSMGATFTQKSGRIYRYYVCLKASKYGYRNCPVKTVAAGEIEAALIDQLRAVLRSPEIITRTLREAKLLEAEETHRLRTEGATLEEELCDLREKATRLVKVGDSSKETLAGELGRTADDLEETREKLESTRSQALALETNPVSEREVIEALQELDTIWEELFPLEQQRLVSLVVERVVVNEDGLEVRMEGDGLRSIVAELTDVEAKKG
ncbi:MAG: recombinase family protein [Planctomycetota bacterium]